MKMLNAKAVDGVGVHRISKVAWILFRSFDDWLRSWILNSPSTFVLSLTSVICTSQTSDTIYAIKYILTSSLEKGATMDPILATMEQEPRAALRTTVGNSSPVYK